MPLDDCRRGRCTYQCAMLSAVTLTEWEAGKKSGSLSGGMYRCVSVDLEQISEYKLYIQISLLAFNCTSPQHTFANMPRLMKFAL